MTMQHEATFETPFAHEAHPYSNPYSAQELNEDEWESEWEMGASNEAHPYSTEWESPEASHYSMPEATEWETHEAHPYSNPYSNPYAQEVHEDEWEMPEAHPYSNPYAQEAHELEWETPEAHPYSNPYSNPYAAQELHEDEWEATPEWEMQEAATEWEDEGEFFFKRAFRGLKNIAKRLAPIGKMLAPIAARALGSMIPGAGVIAGPLAAQLTRQLVREGEMEVESVEASFFGTNESEAEVGHSEAAHEAALTELLAHEAAFAESESEAQALLSGTLPITISVMGGRRALRPVMPTMSMANSRLVRVMRRQGPGGRRLLSLVPTINRLAVSILRSAARSGRPITGPLVVRSMAVATQRVLANPMRVQRAVERNAVLRRRVAPLSPRRAMTFVPGRVPPHHPRRAAGYRPMRSTPYRAAI